MLGYVPSESVNDIYVNMPLTWSMGQDRFAHFNAGWIKHQSQGYQRQNLGLGFRATHQQPQSLAFSKPTARPSKAPSISLV
jgi:hypothetical protein